MNRAGTKEVVIYDQHGRVLTMDETRNLSFSKIIKEGMPKAQFSDWTITKAVNEGMKKSVWVYRSDVLAADMASDILFQVVDTESGEPIPDHPLNKLLKFPNMQVSRKEMMRLTYLWLMLTGLAYHLRILKQKTTEQLLPVSPDRIGPLPSKEIEELITGYAERNKDGKIDDKAKKKYEPGEIIAFRMVDPSRPLLGISPLMASGRVVDTDSSMQEYNKSAMDNQGMLSGLITFEEDKTPDQLMTQAEAWKERHQGAKKAKGTGFIGGKAKYTRLSLTPQEADFTGSRKDNRDEILSAHGTPPQLVGAQESSTMDNYKTSELIHMRTLIMPLVNLVANAYSFNFQMSGELKENEAIVGDFSKVKVLQKDFETSTKAMERFFKSGVPMEQTNKILSLGIEEYPGWAEPYNGKDIVINPATGESNKPAQGDTTTGDTRETQFVRRPELCPEFRATDKADLQQYFHEVRAKKLEGHAKATEKLAKNKSKDVVKVLEHTQDDVYKIMDRSLNSSVKNIKKYFKNKKRDTYTEMEEVIGDIYETSAVKFGQSIIIKARAFEDELLDEVAAVLAEEKIVLEELAMIDSTTAALIIEQVEVGLTEGYTINQIREAIEDTGVFSAERALRISRTVTGTGSSIGQLSAGAMSGATHKIWQNSGFEVRELHQKRNGEEAKIDAVFKKHASDNGVYPRFPLDPRLSASDRVNCRCSMTFR